MKKLAVVIPVYNEEANIEKVLNDWSKILGKKDFDIVVVNDGSKDKTRSIIKKVKKNNKNIKIINKLNGGHGEAIFMGYEYACKKKYSYVFQVDSDDQFSHKDFSKFWKLRKKEFDIMLGYRYHRKDPILRIILSKIVLRFFFMIFFGRIIRDANIPYRLIKFSFLKKFIKISSKKYIAPNIIMSLFSKKIISVEVSHFVRSKGLIRWPIKRLVYFGVRLIYEIFEWNRSNKIK